MDKKKIILDCDPGMDDSMAIVMACKSEALDVLAVTTVNGQLSRRSDLRECTEGSWK